MFDRLIQVNLSLFRMKANESIMQSWRRRRQLKLGDDDGRSWPKRKNLAVTTLNNQLEVGEETERSNDVKRQ